MKSVSTHHAKTHLSALLREVARGEEIHILRGEVPVAKLMALVGVDLPRRPRVGTVTSASVEYDDDAFAPLDEEDLDAWGLT